MPPTAASRGRPDHHQREGVGLDHPAPHARLSRYHWPLTRATVPVSFGRVYASYGSLSPAINLDSKMVGVGTQYDLSKRTLLYANVGSAKRVDLTRTTAFDFGVKHTF